MAKIHRRRSRRDEKTAIGRCYHIAPSRDMRLNARFPPHQPTYATIRARFRSRQAAIAVAEPKADWLVSTQIRTFDGTAALRPPFGRFGIGPSPTIADKVVESARADQWRDEADQDHHSSIHSRIRSRSRPKSRKPRLPSLQIVSSRLQFVSQVSLHIAHRRAMTICIPRPSRAGILKDISWLRENRCCCCCPLRSRQ